MSVLGSTKQYLKLKQFWEYFGFHRKLIIFIFYINLSACVLHIDIVSVIGPGL